MLELWKVPGTCAVTAARSHTHTYTHTCHPKAANAHVECPAGDTQPPSRSVVPRPPCQQQALKIAGEHEVDAAAKKCAKRFQVCGRHWRSFYSAAVVGRWHLSGGGRSARGGGACGHAGGVRRCWRRSGNGAGGPSLERCVCSRSLARAEWGRAGPWADRPNARARGGVRE
jgi:hypothetical protein